MFTDKYAPMASAASASRETRAVRTLDFPQLERQIEVHDADTIFDGARRNGVRIVGACGGRGTCGSCVVRVVEGEVEPAEHARGGASALERQGAGGGERTWLRACQVVPVTDCVIEVAPRSLAPVVRAEPGLDAASASLDVDSPLASRDIGVDAASLADPASDADRVMRALGMPLARLDLAAARELPTVLRGSGGSLRARLHGDELIGFAALGSPGLGLAVDLGTTNVAAFLMDMESGARLASLAIENPQVAWGADVISRINHAARSAAGAAELRGAVLAAIGALAHDLCQAVGARAGDIVDVALCGNTAMHHLLLGLPVGQLGRTPFVAALRDAVDVKARELGLSVCAGAYVHLPPNVGGFVGGDHVTALLATREHWRDVTTSLVMDIGTNTEITLIHQGRFLSASCPSGPALEGGHISCGMRAAEGAIERVAIGDDGELDIGVIGGKAAVGLCGSGVLDALAAFRAGGMLDQRGRLAGQHRHVIEVDGQRAAVLAPDVSFTQADVRAVQLAKAAIRAGVELLAREAGIDELDIERLVIAGAFGAYIDVASGVAVGLFPDLPRERFVQVGNAAGAGVRQMLVSHRARASARELAGQCRYVELSTLAGFQKTFVNQIGFAAGNRTRREH